MTGGTGSMGSNMWCRGTWRFFWWSGLWGRSFLLSLPLFFFLRSSFRFAIFSFLCVCTLPSPRCLYLYPTYPHDTLLGRYRRYDGSERNHQNPSQLDICTLVTVTPHRVSYFSC